MQVTASSECLAAVTRCRIAAMERVDRLARYVRIWSLLKSVERVDIGRLNETERQAPVGCWTYDNQSRMIYAAL